MTIEELAAEVANLKVENRRLRRWGGGLLVFLVAGVAMAASFAGETVTAKRFEVRDDSGNLRATLGLGANGNGNLWLYDANGNKASHLGTTDSGNPGLWLSDSAGVDRVQLLGGDEYTRLRMFDVEGIQAVGLEGNEGYASLGLNNGQNYVHIAAYDLMTSFEMAGGGANIYADCSLHVPGQPWFLMDDWRAVSRFRKAPKGPRSE